MPTKIDGNHPIFTSEVYQKDVVSFNLIEVLRYVAKLLLSDEKSYVICSMQNPQVPVWFWTADSIKEDELREACDYLYENLNVGNSACFVAKPDVATVTADIFITAKKATVHRMKMQSFECQKIIPAKNNSILIEKASASDLETIAKFCRNFEMECFGRHMSYEVSMKNAEEYITQLKTFVMRQNGKAVSMAKRSRETGTHVVINSVYTLPEYRGKGYASAVVAYICKLIFADGKKPMLYTDLSNPSSNRAYTNVGFVPCGRVDEIKLEWS